MQDRLLVCNEYIAFLGTSARSESHFTNYKNVKNFIESHRWKMKEKLICHFNFILSAVLNGSNNFARQPNAEVDLKKHPKFSKLLIDRSKRTKIQSTKMTFLDSHLQKLVCHHNQNGHDIDTCAALVTIVSALRFDETSQLTKTNVKFVPKNCQCEPQKLCISTKDSCFDTLKGFESKTGILNNVAILPRVTECFLFLQNSGQTINRSKYTSFLKTTIDSDITPHCLRSYLPNITIDTRQKLNWKSAQVFQKHYCHKKTRLFDLFLLLENQGLSY